MMVRLTQYLRTVKNRRYKSSSGFNMAVMQHLCADDVPLLIHLIESLELALDNVEVAVNEDHGNSELAKADILYTLQQDREAINEFIQDKHLTRWGDYEPEAEKNSGNGESKD